MVKIGELDLLPISGWEAPPTYFISAGGLGYLALSWLMYYISQYLPPGKGMQDFKSARFLPIDTTEPTEKYDLPEHDWARNFLFKMDGDLNKIIEEVNGGFYPGIKEFYEDTPVAKIAREDIGGNLKHGAGTTRPFGRIGFFYNWETFYNRLVGFVKEPIENTAMKFGKTFNIISGTSRQFFLVTSLAGGTGSSCFLDIAATLRKVRSDHYPNENWTIVGIFTLADVLASDKKVSVELHRKKMRANTYAALKELDHFLSGQVYSAEYGRDGNAKITISNRRDQDKLFDLVFLVDTPNQNNEPLSGRKEVAQFLAQALLQLSLTTLNKEFANRLVDSTANLLFRQQYPPDLGIDDGKERQQFLFSSIGLSTLDLPVRQYVEYSCYRIAEKLVGELWNIEITFMDDSFIERIITDICLNESSIEAAFSPCVQQVILDIETELSNIRRAANPMERLRNLAQALENFPIDEARRNADHIKEDRLRHLFPRGGGAVRQEMDRLVQKGFLPHVPVIISNIIESLEKYRNRLQREHEEAVSQARVGEVPTQLSQNNTQAGISQNQIFVDVLNLMEQSWSTWQNRFFRVVYRSRFFNQFEGEISSVLESFHRYQEAANRLIIWPKKLEFINEAIKDLQRMREYYTRQQNHLEKIKSELFSRKNNIERKVDPGSRYKLLATDAETFFKEIFLSHIGSENHVLNKLSETLKDKGLFVKGGNVIKLDDWEQEPVNNIVDSLYSFCRKELLGPEIDPETDLSAAHKCYQDGLDHRIFHPQEHPTSFSKVLSLWQDRANLSLLFRSFPPECSTYIISGCRTGDEPTAWDKVLNLYSLRMLPGGPPNKCTLITLGLGFPVQNIARVEDWYKFYVQLRREGWPLHLFNEEHLDTMIEPYMEWLRLPNKEEAEMLLDEAMKWQIVSLISENHSEIIYIGQEVLESLPNYIKSFFYEYRPEPKTFSLQQIEDILRSNKTLLENLKQSLLNKIVKEKLSSDATWSTRQEKIKNDTADIRAILQWCKEIQWLVEDNNHCHFSIELCKSHIFTRDEFSNTFFEEKERKRSITKEEFIFALQRRETLCRWITRKVLKRLIDPKQRQETIRKLSENEFCDFLWDVVSSNLDYRI